MFNNPERLLETSRRVELPLAAMLSGFADRRMGDWS